MTVILLQPDRQKGKADVMKKSFAKSGVAIFAMTLNRFKPDRDCKASFWLQRT